MISIVVCCHVEVEDIAILNGSCVWNSVADNLIDWGAATAREIVVVARRRVSSCIDNIIVHDFVNFFSCHSHFHCCVTGIQSFSRDATYFSQLNKVFIWVNRNLFVCKCLKVLIWSSRSCIVRLKVFLRHVSKTCEGFWERSEWPCKVTSWLSSLINFWFFVRHLVEFPKSSKTLLPTEVGRR